MHFSLGFFHSPGVGQAMIITLIELIKSLKALTFCFLWDQTYGLGLWATCSAPSLSLEKQPGKIWQPALQELCAPSGLSWCSGSDADVSYPVAKVSSLERNNVCWSLTVNWTIAQRNKFTLGSESARQDMSPRSPSPGWVWCCQSSSLLREQVRAISWGLYSLILDTWENHPPKGAFPLAPASLSSMGIAEIR